MAAAEVRCKDMQLTKDEVGRLSDAFKDPKFRELFHEYAQELQDPENRALYEREISKLEQERGVNVTFIHPEPGYVLKTKLASSTPQNGENEKVFLNLCTNENVVEPSCQRESSGYCWHLPYALAPPREDLDKKRCRCRVYDIVFHPSTLYMGAKNARFKKLVEDTAIEAIEKNFNVELDRKNVKLPKMKFMGTPTSTVIRKVSSEGLKDPPKLTEKFCVPYPELKAEAFQDEKKDTESEEVSAKDDVHVLEATQPKHVIKFRKHFDMGDYAYDAGNARGVVNNIPQELVIEIDLPLITSATSIELDVTEKSLALKTKVPAKYELQLSLPHSVNEDDPKAKFDVDNRKLTVTLTVNANCASKQDIDELNTKQNETELNSCECNFVEMPTTLQEDAEAYSESELQRKFESENEKSKITYQLPSYEVRQTVDKMILLLHVQNVDPKSLNKEFSDDRTLISFSFITIGDGFVPFHHKLIVKAAEDKLFDNSTSTFDFSDKSVVVILGKEQSSQGDWNYIHVGKDQAQMTQVVFVTMTLLSEKMANIKAETKEMQVEGGKSFNDKILVTKLTEELLEVHIGDNGLLQSSSSVDNKVPDQNEFDSVQTSFIESKPTSDNGKHEYVPETISDSYLNAKNTRVKSASICIPEVPTRPKIHKVRSVSESGEDWNRSPAHKPRGILKLRKFVRSISESSDDFSISPQEVVSSPDLDIPEESSNDEGESQVKKSVRFNEVVCRSLFRSNSSILGQRKKNQRKQRAKKRAVQRRMSESEGSEGEADVIHSLVSKVNINKPALDAQDINENVIGIESNAMHEAKSVDNMCVQVNDLSLEDDKGHLDAQSDSTCSITNLNFCEESKVNSVNNNNNNNLNSTNCHDANEETSKADDSFSTKVSKSDLKTKRKKKRKSKQFAKNDALETMLSWEDSNIEDENPDMRMSFSNALVFELDT